MQQTGIEIFIYIMQNRDDAYFFTIIYTIQYIQLNHMWIQGDITWNTIQYKTEFSKYSRTRIDLNFNQNTQFRHIA